MKPEILAEIKRRSAEMKRRIASGEVLVCSSARPKPDDAPADQKWFHEEAKCESATGRFSRLYLCPACGTRFPVELRKIVPQEK